MAVMDTFMEAYNNGVLIHGNDAELANIFENAEPISYEEALENIYECQYSMEAICTMNENAIMMEAAGVATLTEGVVGAFFEAAIEKIKKLGTTIKNFAIACVKKIKEFFMELYKKATPMDKAMQMFKKNAVTINDINMAKANGMKIPGSLWVPTGQMSVEDLYKKFVDSDDCNKAKNLLIAAGVTGNTSGSLETSIETIKNIAEKMETDMKDKYTAIGRLLSDDTKNSPKGQFKSIVARACGTETPTNDNGNITADQWELTKTLAFTGQSLMRTYQSEVQKKSAETINTVQASAKNVEAQATANVTKAADDKKDSAIETKGLVSKWVNAEVALCTKYAKWMIKGMNGVFLPAMRKQHRAACATFIWVNNHVKSTNNKSEKALKVGKF